MLEEEGRRSNGGTLWWNEEVKEAVPKKKDSHKAMCIYSTKENRRRYESMINKEKKAVSKII